MFEGAVGLAMVGIRGANPSVSLPSGCPFAAPLNGGGVLLSRLPTGLVMITPMMISYDAASVPLRPDLLTAHRNQWMRLAQPGTWWSGAERVALAREVRRAKACELCRRRKQSLSPYTIDGAHEAVDSLPAAAVDVVHRVATDPGRLTKDWFDRVIAAGLSHGQYVEAIGVIVTVFSIDSFCRGIGVPPHPLPDPIGGQPSAYRPSLARMEKAWVRMLPNGRFNGSEADLWGDMPGGQTGNVVRALSLVPDEVRGLKELSAAHYLSPRQMMNLVTTPRSIDRTQIELIAGRVSALRGCFY
jgi:hypothetical protein